jgi:hypothetical protein
VDAKKEPIDGVWIPAQWQFQAASAELIDPVRHFSCTLGQAVAMKA